MTIGAHYQLSLHIWLKFNISWERKLWNIWSRFPLYISFSQTAFENEHKQHRYDKSRRNISHLIYANVKVKGWLKTSWKGIKFRQSQPKAIVCTGVCRTDWISTLETNQYFTSQIFSWNKAFCLFSSSFIWITFRRMNYIYVVDSKHGLQSSKNGIPLAFMFAEQIASNLSHPAHLGQLILLEYPPTLMVNLCCVVFSCNNWNKKNQPRASSGIIVTFCINVTG